MALRIHNRNDEDDHDDEELRQSDPCEHGHPFALLEECWFLRPGLVVVHRLLRSNPTSVEDSAAAEQQHDEEDDDQRVCVHCVSYVYGSRAPQSFSTH